MKRFILPLVALFAVTARAEVKLPAVLGSNMVLQQQADVNLWGQAAPNKTVTITASWTKQRVQVKADAEGAWQTTFPTTKAGGPYTMTFSDGEKGKQKTLTNVLLGEVWVSSGQSNMEMPVGGFMYQPVEGGIEASLEAGRYPDIRMFTVPRCTSQTPKADCDTTWQVSTPLTVRTFSAAAYFFAREVQRQLGVPVGIITSNWGGTCIEAWMSQQALDGVKDKNNEAIDKRTGPNAKTVLYNGMICPINKMTAKGFIWYQGESNRDQWQDYAKLQVAMVKSWRTVWGNQEMPFYITQITPYYYGGGEKRLNALFIDQQYLAAQQLDHCEVACTIDLGNFGIIHPEKKIPVGQRLAWLALTNDYKMKGLPSRYPQFDRFDVADNGHMTLHFTNVCSPNYFEVADPAQQDCFDGRQQAKGFEVAGADRRFFPAKANHKYWTNTIEVWSDSVPQPVAVRYAYRNWTDGNVKMQTGLPLRSFRTDNWDMPDL